MRGHRLDAERPEDERHHVGGGRVAVVDDDPEAALADRLDVERREQVLRVALADAGRVVDRADAVDRGAAQLAAGEVLLDLLLQRRRQLDPRVLEELDPDHLGVGRADADVEARVVALRLQQVPADRRGQRAQVGDLDARSRRGPESIARLIIRQAACESRLATTRAPRLSAVPSEAASRTAGLRRQVDVDQARRRRPARRAAPTPRDSQIRLSWICVPESTSL